MNFVRTHVTSSNTPLASLRGVIPPTPDCKGPYISQDRGMDTMCCARCHIVRHQIYREKGGFIVNSLAIDYLHRLSRFQSDATSACILTTCGRQLLYVPPATNELHRENVRSRLKQQFLLWKELRLVDMVDPDNIGNTDAGFPVVFPSNDCIRKDEFGGDEGVQVSEGELKVTDMAKAFASGKWVYLINYYTIMSQVYSMKEKMSVF